MFALGSVAALAAACQTTPATPTAAPLAPTAAPKPTTPPAATTSAPAAATTAPTQAPGAAALTKPTQAAPAQGTGSIAMFRVDETGDAASLNGLLSNTAASRRRAVQVFSSLYQYDLKNQIVPDLAADMPQQPDDSTFIIKLKSGVKFHSGKSLTADDVKFTYTQVLDPNYGAIWRTAVEPAIDSITVQDASTIQFKLKRPYSPMLAKFALIPIVNSEQPKDEIAQKPDGTGPFKVVGYEKNNVMQLARHEAYHFSGQPSIAQLTINVVPDEASRIANLANGISQLMPEPSLANLSVLKSRGLMVNSVSAPASTYGFVNIGKRPDGPMSNKSLRRALAFAMDRSAIVDTVWSGQATPGQVYIRPQLWPYDPNFKPFSATPDLDQAKSEATASGRAGDRFVIAFGNTETLNSTATLLQAAAKAAGLNVDLQAVDPASTTALLQGDTWDIVLSDTYTGSNSGLEPDAVNSLFRTKGSSNFGQYSNPDMDAEVDAAIFAPSHDAASPHYKRIMQIDAADIAVLTVVYHNYIEALAANVKNYTTSPLAQYDLRTIQVG